jgi:hypothetical protein
MISHRPSSIQAKSLRAKTPTYIVLKKFLPRQLFDLRGKFQFNHVGEDGGRSRAPFLA